MALAVTAFSATLQWSWRKFEESERCPLLPCWYYCRPAGSKSLSSLPRSSSMEAGAAAAGARGTRVVISCAWHQQPNEGASFVIVLFVCSIDFCCRFCGSCQSNGTSFCLHQLTVFTLANAAIAWRQRWHWRENPKCSKHSCYMYQTYLSTAVLLACLAPILRAQLSSQEPPRSSDGGRITSTTKKWLVPIMLALGRSQTWS